MDLLELVATASSVNKILHVCIRNYRRVFAKVLLTRLLLAPVNPCICKSCVLSIKFAVLIDTFIFIAIGGMYLKLAGNF